MEKSKKNDKVCCNGRISHLVSSSGESITNFQNPKDTEVSTVSSERVCSAEQPSIRSDFNSEAGKPLNGKRKDLDSFMACHTKVLKTDSSSSKESGEVVQLNSVDSTDPIPCQSSKEIFGEKRSLLTHSCESNVVSHERESSIVTNADSIAASLEKPQHYCAFDLNEGMEAKGAIYVVAKVGVPMGSPKKPLHFGGELGWRRSSVSAFQPTSSKFSKIENKSYNIRATGIDLNVAAMMDSEQHSEECYSDFVNSKAPKRFLPDLNSHSENEDNCNKPGASTFDLNNNFEDTPNNLVHHIENQQLLRSVAADYHAGTLSGGSNVSQSIFNMRRPPSHLINLSSRGFGHVQPQPFLVATTPNAEQVQTVVPSGLYIGKINSLAPKFYPPSVLPQLNNHHVIAPIPQIPGPVLAAYPGPLHLIENQRINPHAFANMRPNFVPNGSIPLMEDGNRGIVNPEFLRL